MEYKHGVTLNDFLLSGSGCLSELNVSFQENVSSNDRASGFVPFSLSPLIDDERRV